ncbi:hypothetical protein B0H14DRAFT_1621548 [Mycena olivaceomarginata]|nr:hypothetical protein B0H14DRAFT_1621548 [Mycena olivaceomarginata]
MLTFFVVLASGLHIRSARAAGGALDFLEVHDPVGVVQCDQYNLTWQGGVPPFSVQVRDPVQQGNIYAFWAIVQDDFILWDVDKLGVAPGSLPLTFEVAVSDSTGTTATSRTESVAPATIALDASGLCTSIITCVRLSAAFSLPRPSHKPSRTI